VDTRPWQHHNLTFKAPAPGQAAAAGASAGALAAGRAERALGIYELRRERLAADGMPPTRRFGETVADRLQWQGHKIGSAPPAMIRASPTFYTAVGDSMNWQPHAPSTPQAGGVRGRARIFTSGVAECMDYGH
jgi:hypothetical protein